MAKAIPPLSLGSSESPTGQEFLLYKYGVLEELQANNLRERAFNLKTALATYPGHAEFCQLCRPSGQKLEVIRWVIEGQCRLLLEKGKSFTIHDFGYPMSEEDSGAYQVFEGMKPSIKMKKETILSKYPTPSATMHDP